MLAVDRYPIAKCAPFPGLHADYPSRRHSSRALALVIDAIRYKGQ